MSILSRAVVGGAGALLSAAAALFTAFKAIEWAFGLATLRDNIDETQSAGTAFLKWLLTKDPDTAVLVAVGALFLFGLLMMAWAVRRTQAMSPSEAIGTSPALDFATHAGTTERQPPTVTPEPAPASESGIPENPQAKHELAAFAMDRVLPAIDAQRDLQRAIIRKLCNGMTVIEALSREGLVHSGSHPGFEAERKNLVKAISNGRVNVTFERLMFLIEQLARMYGGVCSNAVWLCTGTELDHRSDKELAPLYKIWQTRHVELESEYERFRRDPQFPLLYDLKPKRLGESFSAED